jgi:hypothetical protein
MGTVQKSQTTSTVQGLQGALDPHGRLWRQRRRHEGTHLLASSAGELVTAGLSRFMSPRART